MKTEFITREDAINAMVRVRERMLWPMDDADTALCGAVDELRKLRPVDVRTVVRGEWVGVQLGDMRCSVCGEVYGVCGGLLGDYNYCPNCGADMREVQKGGEND